MLAQILSALSDLGLDSKKALAVLMSNSDRLEMTKALLGIEDSEQDGIIMFALQMIEERILVYINHDTLPDTLEKVLVIMAVSYIKDAGLGSSETNAGTVTSIKRGDVQTTFSSPEGMSGSSRTFNLGPDMGDFFGWMTVLNEYRRLRW